MSGPVVILLVVLAVVPVFLLILRLDAWLTEREYQRRIRGDEVEQYRRARAAVARHVNSSNVRLGHTREENRNE